MGRGSFKRHSSGSARREKRFECTSSDAAHSASFAAGRITATAVVKRAETAFDGNPEDSDNAETAFVARCGFRFSKTVKKYSAADSTEASAFTL